ncbi:MULTISPECIES: SDR family NAD(P)-dependent oxidoreductase [unclassified Micromonospora]|uniref:SDR family NAD(P)-dependent oxidoreductase n=1 Tax=unclassified Micromonospora TaxID=2617518 RepID=UPI0022B71FBF|nr:MULTISPECIES: SDR family NAD(P)-dependent oxidoreductase [unclassified Micromonospora]MCZ7423279.1 SDR family NAD(P)-dependent oxidoreductase [Verrucosispora sp. WMMA2121]WBB90967.1 SDR family NAD(P)-dependent oxidoreductase [Verrucosispora sp. WMMC514]
MTETMLMTGASRGIGWHAAVAMLAANPRLRMFVTDRTGGLAEALRDKSGNQQVYGVRTDLASLGSVRAAADHVMRRARVTSFVGNAGLQVTSGARCSADGYEVTFAVNVLANHLLLRLLGDQLRRAVITASDTHFGDFRHNLGLAPAPVWRPPAELARPDGPHTSVAGRTAYSTSKLAVIHLVHEWARRLDNTEVYSWNPGFVPGTGLTRDAGPIVRFAAARVLPLLTLTPLSVSPRTAGRHLARVATGPAVAPSGSYVNLGRAERSSDASYDPQREGELFEAAQALTAT